jgi:hypothetical protein
LWAKWVGHLSALGEDGDDVSLGEVDGQSTDVDVVDINMPRDPNTGKPRGFAWLMYADQRSTVLAVDKRTSARPAL